MSAIRWSDWSVCVILAALTCSVYTATLASDHGIDGMVDVDQKCEITVTKHMKAYFPSKLFSKKPHFVQFKIHVNHTFSSTNQVFKPLYWSWTFAESSEPYPFLSWNLDYGILSFGLLDAKTYAMKDVWMDVSPSCNITFGTRDTTKMIVRALVPLINITESDFPTYPTSYFCFYHMGKDFSQLHYQASLYFIFPISSIEFSCSVVYWVYSEKHFEVRNQTPASHLYGFHKWTTLLLFPFFVGTGLLLYFPIILLWIAAWLSRDEEIISETHVHELLEVSFDHENPDDSHNGDWLFADGNTPFGLSDLLSFRTCGMHDKFPIFVSRCRRFLFLMAAPVFIYIQCAMYYQGMGMWGKKNKITVEDLVSAGAPMGFLSIFGKVEDRHKVFVPLLGGPVGVIALYYSVGILFVVLPRSLKQVFENGIQNTEISINSPLFYDFRKILRLSMMNIKQKHLSAGYGKVSTLLKCSFYCLFTNTFWKSVWDDQTSRYRSIGPMSPVCKCLKCVVLPIYVLLCTLEILLCFLYYGVPFSGFVVLVVKGATRSIGHLGRQCRCLRFRFVSIFVLCLFSIFVYISSLMFVKSFVFIVQILTFTFVAIIVYPSASFGYLFFVIVLLYYMIKLIRNFGDQYEELLVTAVGISRRLQGEGNFVYIHEGQLNVFNVNVDSLKGIHINGKQVCVPNTVLQTLKTNDDLKVKKKNNVYGIRKELFNFLVTHHKPVHLQILTLCFKAMLAIAFVSITFNILKNYVTGPRSEVSEVMHVIFIVAMGTIPQLVDMIFSHSNSVLAREIEEVEIEASIVEYWNRLKS